MNDRELLKQIRGHTGGWVRWTTIDVCFALIAWAETIRDNYGEKPMKQPYREPAAMPQEEAPELPAPISRKRTIAKAVLFLAAETTVSLLALFDSCENGHTFAVAWGFANAITFAAAGLIWSAGTLLNPARD